MSLSERSTKPALRLGYIDQLRAAAALYVAVFHAYLVLWPADTFHDTSGPLYLRWANYGHFGVTMFIVLSGFSLALGPAMRGATKVASYWRFMVKRALRIIPPYWVALAGSLVLLALAPKGVTSGNSGGLGAEWSGKGMVPGKSIAAFFFLVHDLVKVPSPNSPLWSIAVEWHLYFFFPLLVFIGCRYGMRVMLAGSMVAGLVLYVALYHTSANGTTPHFLGLFALGIFTAYAIAAARRDGAPPWLERIRVSGWWFVVAAFVVYAVLSSLSSASQATVDNLLVLGDLVSGLLFAVGLFLLAQRPSGSEAEAVADGVEEVGIGSGVGLAMTRVGLISYSLYLVHSPTEKIVWHFVVSKLSVPAPVGFAIEAVLGIAVSLIAAQVLYLLVERRSMGWSRQFQAA